MSDNTKNDTDASSQTNTLKVAPKKLQLTKTIESANVQQTFARGRSKTVAVEVKRTRTFSRDKSGKIVEDNKKSEKDSVTKIEDNNSSSDNDNLNSLTDSEKDVRLRALAKAEMETNVEKSYKFSEDEAEDKAEDGTILRNEETKKEIEGEKTKQESTTTPSDNTANTKDTTIEKKQEHNTHHHTPAKKKETSGTQKSNAEKLKAKEHKRQKGKLTISNAFDQDERVRSLASVKRARQKAKRQSNISQSSDEKVVREIILPESITVQELSIRMAVRSQEVTKELMKLGIICGSGEEIDADTAELIIAELGHTSKRVTEGDVEDILKIGDVDEADLEPRAPVVTIMGHVDHGKTSLLDALRSTDVVAGEAGGITQHIGAYRIETETMEHITFLDTPGHAAFTAMRARGANVTDIVILVVAADDGIMPQTKEAINHAKIAEVPIIVAINKIDKPDADPSKVKNELLQYNLIPEDLGGDVIVVEVSAQEKTNLDKLIEAILLQAEMLELKASHKQRAGGVVIESQIDKARGIVATLLVQRGTIRTGDIIVAGKGYGRIRLMQNDKKEHVDDVTPSIPVEVLGLNNLPDAGDEFAIVDFERQAREIAEYRTKLQRDRNTEKSKSVSVEKLFEDAKTGAKELRLIIKGDVQGSVEAIIGSLEKISYDEVSVKFVHTGAGGITESDVTLASAVGAVVLAFNVRAGANVREIAEDESVDIRYYSVIYNLIDDMKGVIGGMLSPIIREEFIGNAEILQIFKMSKYGKVAGCIVRNGIVRRGAGVRLIRDNVVIHEGKLKTLKRFKEDVQEAKEGIECGMAFENYEDIKEGDFIEAFEFVEEARNL